MCNMCSRCTNSGILKKKSQEVDFSSVLYISALKRRRASREWLNKNHLMIAMLRFRKFWPLFFLFLGVACMTN